MNKAKYGESIVNQIIDAYRNSDEFKKDAVEFVKHEITNEINAIGANAFYRFAEEVKAMGDAEVIPLNADLCDSVENTKVQREWLDALFEMTFGEGEHARP